MTSDPAHAHLIGVSGNGMFPLALLMREAGIAVTGSDASLNPARHASLADRGVRCWETGQKQSARRNMADARNVVVSPAIPSHHPELRAARQNNCHIETRAEALARLINGRDTVCIAGSHGKSTVTAMVMAILSAAWGDRFGYMIGAEGAAALPARLGADDSIFVMEACEAHGALPAWRPTHAVLTNIDDEHTDHYPSGGGLTEAFCAFLRRVPDHGAIIACGDDPAVAALIARLPRPALSFGLSPKNRLCATVSGGIAHVSLDGAALGALSLRVPGEHNLRNALAALALALHLRIPAPRALTSLEGFSGLTRRLQRLDEGTGPRLFDDFAHHPTEVTAALTALRPSTQGRLIAVLEPQLNSRVSRLAADFAASLRKADIRILLPVSGDGEHGAGETGDEALSSACEAAGLDIMHAPSIGDLRNVIGSVTHPEDTVVVMSGRLGASPAGLLLEPLRAIRKRCAGSADGDAPGQPSVLIGRRVDDIADVLATILATAGAHPDAPAIEMGPRRLSYAQLISRAAALADRLSASGIGPADTVGVCLPRSMDRVTALVAALSLGAVYVPLDPTLPRSRLDQMLADSEVGVVIVNAASPALSTSGRAVISCDFLAAGPPELTSRPEPDGMAYAVYTSGTSGRPKAIRISRRAISNYAASAVRIFELDPSSRVSLVSAFGFDVSIGDMIMSLAAGACLVIPTDLEAQPGTPLAKFINHARLTHLSLTPSLLSAIPPADYPDLRAVIVAGEACPQALIDRWATGRLFFNAYGPAEATVEVTIARCWPHHGVTVGTPIDNVGLCILTDDLHPAAMGTEGEVCIFGVALAEGYHNRPDLTAQRFPWLPAAAWHPSTGPLRVYRTGDRGLIDQDGQLCLLGRIDEQIKFNGFRIEPAEVETILCQQPGILDACVSVVRGTKVKSRLLAHIVLDPQHGPLDRDGLSTRLKQLLPHYMLPSVFLPVRDIPRTLNGKRDRSALPIPAILQTPRKQRRAKSATEQRLIELLLSYLDSEQLVGRRKSLFRLGLDSLSLANFLMEIEEEFGVSLDMVLDPGADTIEALALMVDARLGEPRHASATDGYTQMAGRMLPLLAGWPGAPAGRHGLARHMAATHGGTALFWVFQLGEEFEALAGALAGDGVRLFGLRSGDRFLDYLSDDLPTITQLYADEIESIAPAGRLCLGGNCQGGMMMRHIAIELLRRGRDIGLVILMEQGRFSPVSLPVLLLFGEMSYLNPYAQIKNPDQLFRLAYSGGYAVEMIPGGHGEYFLPENIAGLAHAIRPHIKAAADSPGNAPPGA